MRITIDSMFAIVNRRCLKPSHGLGRTSNALIDTVWRQTFSTESDDDGDFVTGTVKFYNRQKFYGFVNPLKDPTLDVFLHRGDIVSDLDKETHPANPFLKPGEHIRFKIETVDGLPHAKEITFATGRPIPPLRPSFMANWLKGIHLELGENVHKIMVDEDVSSAMAAEDQGKLVERIQDAWKIAQTKIDATHALIDRMGMKVEEFSTTAEKQAKRGKEE